MSKANGNLETKCNVSYKIIISTATLLADKHNVHAHVLADGDLL